MNLTNEGIEVCDVRVRFEILDQTNHESPQASPHLVDAVIIIYDTTEITSFENVQKLFLSVNGGEYVILVGTKCNRKDDCKVPNNVVKSFAKRYNLNHVRVSSKLGTGVEDLFEQIAVATLIKRYESYADSSDSSESSSD